MGQKITSISLKGFRAFQELEISGVGRVNLITGKNNTGKSCLLEALRLFAWNGAPTAILEIINERQEGLIDQANGETAEESEGLILEMLSLFNGFPKLSENPDPISIIANGEARPMKLMLHLDWVTKERDNEGNLRLVPQCEVPGNSKGDLALIAQTECADQMITRLERF